MSVQQSVIPTQEQRADNVRTVQAENRGQEATNVATIPEIVNRPTQPTILDLVVRLDRAQGLHPFTVAVMRVVMPEKKLFPTMEKYSGKTDPEKYSRSFVDAISAYSSMTWSGVGFFLCL